MDNIHSAPTANDDANVEPVDTNDEDTEVNHDKDMPYVPTDKLKLIGSVSEYATQLLNEKISELKTIPLNKRIVVVSDKKDMAGLVLLKDRDFGVFHNDNTHLPMFKQAAMEWLDINNIPHSDDMGVLLRMMGGK